MINLKNIIILGMTGLLLSGCSSLGRGVTEAILEKQEAEDTRMCEIWGAEFSGIKP
jgi:uncharacterized protein YceK